MNLINDSHYLTSNLFKPLPGLAVLNRAAPLPAFKHEHRLPLVCKIQAFHFDVSLTPGGSSTALLWTSEAMRCTTRLYFVKLLQNCSALS